MRLKLTSIYNREDSADLIYGSYLMDGYLESKCERRSNTPIGLMGSGFRIELLQLAVF